MDTRPAMEWTEEQYRAFGVTPQVARHHYHESPLFSREQIIALLESHPHRFIRGFTMGHDPEDYSDWKIVDVDRKWSGEDIWRAVESGRLWINILHVDRENPAFAELIRDMYEHLNEHCPQLGGATSAFSTLILSSPGAMVYYHLDAEPNMLWHIHGEKRMWVYPAMDLRFVPQEMIEDIYAGAMEDIPFRREFDQHAQCFHLKPGDVASWPHNGPHRIENIDMCVSLATSYYSPSVYYREYVQLANKFIVRKLGVRQPSMDEHGLAASCKRISYRVLDKIRPFARSLPRNNFMTRLTLDPDARNGIRQLDEEIVASYARQP